MKINTNVDVNTYQLMNDLVLISNNNKRCKSSSRARNEKLNRKVVRYKLSNRSYAHSTARYPRLHPAVSYSCI